MEASEFQGLLAEPLEPDADGYVHLPEGPGLSPVAAFVEKPDRVLAERHVRDGYLWNSGNFMVRASVLLGKSRKQDAADFTSGLLIGADIAFGLQQGAGDVVFVMGSPTLTRLYAAAIDAAGQRATEIDGETAFLAGINAIAGQI